MEYHPSNVKFAVWMDSKFSNHSTMDWYMKNALWIYWIRGDDEEVLIDKVLSDLEETYVNKEDEIAEIFRIETNIFDFKTPLCKAFNEFNYLLKIDMDLLTHDIPRFKTYEEYKTAWIHEWNEDVPWIPKEPWSKNGVPYEIVDHHCVQLRLKNGHVEWPTCHSNEDGYCDGGDLPGRIQNENMVYSQDYEWYEGLKDGELKDKALMKKAKFEKS
ncbi:hypothetical protein Tco_1547886 [Tanacetum coccineum]